MNLPCRWREGGLGEFAGTVRFRRHFGYPGQIDSYERVWLTFAGIEGRATVTLNGHSLGKHQGSHGPLEFDTSALLQARNELVVDVEANSGNGGLWGEVTMEIRCAAFLRDVRAWQEMDHDQVVLHLAGTVVGSCERPLDLYALIERGTVIQGSVEATEEGRPFHLISKPLEMADSPMDVSTLRVELVNGAVVWFGVDVKVVTGRN